MTTYSSTLGTALLVTGDATTSGTWGNTTNFSLGTVMEQAIAGYVNQVFSSTNVTLVFNANADAGTNSTAGLIWGGVATGDPGPSSASSPVSARNLVINCTGTTTSGTGNTLILPTSASGGPTKNYFILNNTTGGPILVQTAGQSGGVSIPVGYSASVVNNGTSTVQLGTVINGTTIAATGKVSITLSTSDYGYVLNNLTGSSAAGSAAFLASVSSGNGVGMRLAQNSIASWDITNVATTGAFAISNGTTNIVSINPSSGVVTIATSLNGNLTGSTVDGTNAVGYLGLPQSSNTTLALVDRGKSILATGTITIPNSTFAAGDAVTIVNNSASSITITCNLTTTHLAGTATTGTTRTLAQWGIATIYFITSTTGIISGSGLT